MKSLSILHTGFYERLMEFSEGDSFIYEFSWEISLKNLKKKGVYCHRVGWVSYSELNANVMIDGCITRMEFFDLVKNKQIKDLFITNKSIKDLMEHDDDVYLYIKENFPENLI